MTAILSPTPIFKGFANDGTPLAYGLLYTYAAGTTTPQATFVDSTQGTPNTNPIILNARGECPLWLTPGLSYKYNLTDLNGNQIAGYPVDNIIVGTVSGANITYDQTAAEIAAGITPSNKSYPELDLRRYGAILNGVANDYAAINSAILVGQQYKGATITFPQNQNVKCNTGLTWDISRVGINLNGSTLDMSAVTGGNGLTPTMSITDPNQTPGYGVIHPISNGRIVGPGATTLTPIGLYISSASSNSTLTACCFSKLSFLNWGQDIQINTNAWCLSFEDVVGTIEGISPTAYAVLVTTGAVIGERIVFTRCWWFNRPLVIRNSGNCDIDFVTGSLDYSGRAITVDGGGSVTLFGGHWEDSSDADYWGYATVDGSSINIIGTRLTLTNGTPKTLSPFYCDGVTSAITNSGIFLPFMELTGSGQITSGVPLIGGTGNYRVGTLVQEHNGVQPYLGVVSNLFAYGGFESANYTVEWPTLTNAARAASNPHTGTQALVLTAGSGSNSAAIAQFPIIPGQYMQGVLWQFWPTAASATLQITMSYIDKGGTNVLAVVYTVTQTSPVAAYAALNLKTTTPAPNGAAFVQLKITLTGAASASLAYIDDVALSPV